MEIPGPGIEPEPQQGQCQAPSQPCCQDTPDLRAAPPERASPMPCCHTWQVCGRPGLWVTLSQQHRLTSRLCHTLVILTLFPHPLRGQTSLIKPVCSEGSNDSCSLFFFLKFIFHDSGFTVFCPPLRNSSDLSLSLCSVLKFTQVY